MTDSQLPAAIQNFIEATNRGDCEALVADAGLQRRAQLPGHKRWACRLSR